MLELSGKVAVITGAASGIGRALTRRFGAEVTDAITTDRFWILTHPDTRHAPVERMMRAEAQANPA